VSAPLTAGQTLALARLYRRETVRVKELLELEQLGLVKRVVPQPGTLAEWELTDEGKRRAEEISR